MLPAELVTLDKPCCALPAVSEAVSFAEFAPEETALVAFSVVEDCARRWMTHLDCRSASRGMRADDMIAKRSRYEGNVQWQAVSFRFFLPGKFGGWSCEAFGKNRAASLHASEATAFQSNQPHINILSIYEYIALTYAYDI